MIVYGLWFHGAFLGLFDSRQTARTFQNRLPAYERSRSAILEHRVLDAENVLTAPIP
jgi:hypothetical protein